MIRLYVQDDLDPARPDIPLSKQQAHYLFNVMRLRAGARVALFNGRDGEACATLVETGSRQGVLAVETIQAPFRPAPDIWLVVALVKRAPLETIVEKATELGVRRVRLITTRRTNAERTNVERLSKIALEAAEQTGRHDVPEVVAPEPLERLLDAWDPSRRLMFCDEAGDDPDAEWGGPQGRARPVLEALLPLDLPPLGEVPAKLGMGAPPAGGVAGARQPPPSRRVAPIHLPQRGRIQETQAGEPTPWAVLIGPEGGFDPDERARLRALPFVTPVTLGPRILRADTAAIAALTLWQSARGDWKP